MTLPRTRPVARRTLHAEVRLSIVPTNFGGGCLIVVENVAGDVVEIPLTAVQVAAAAMTGLCADAVARVRVRDESGTRAVDTWGVPR